MVTDCNVGPHSLLNLSKSTFPFPVMSPTNTYPDGQNTIRQYESLRRATSNVIVHLEQTVWLDMTSARSLLLPDHYFNSSLARLSLPSTSSVRTPRLSKKSSGSTLGECSALPKCSTIDFLFCSAISSPSSMTIGYHHQIRHRLQSEDKVRVELIAQIRQLRHSSHLRFGVISQ